MAASVVATARDRVLAFVNDPNKVSVGQRRAVEHPGNFFLSACPGSGKTRTVGVRIALASVGNDDRLVAGTSYTNTAVGEMQKAAAAAGAPIVEPYFVGTLHGFLLEHVFYPFAHLVMNCEPPARLVFGDFHRANDPKVFAAWEGGRPKYPPIAVWDFHFRPDGSVAVNRGDVPRGVPFDADDVAGRCRDQVVKAKRALAAKGIASPSDAMYWALEVLRTQPTITNALAARYEEIIVDEVQDTSAVQLECIRVLHTTETLRSIVLTGDLEQAIYEWAGAKPDDVEVLVDDLGLDVLLLTENFRSSQALCDVAHKFSRRPSPDGAVGENHAYGRPPELLIYDKDEPRDAVAAFERRLDELGIETGEARVLCRNRSLQNALLEAKSVSLNRTIRTLGRAAVAVREAGAAAIARRDAEELERLLKSFIWKEQPATLEWEERLAIRDALMRLFELLPDVDVPLEEWTPRARTAVKDALSVFGTLEVNPSNKMKVRPGTGKVIAADAFGRRVGTPLEPLTVHSVKGETHDAVLLVGRKTAKYEHAAQWLAPPDSVPESEEVRVAYVALTRAAKLFVVALPSDTAQNVIDEFVARGFVLTAQPEE